MTAIEAAPRRGRVSRALRHPTIRLLIVVLVVVGAMRIHAEVTLSDRVDTGVRAALDQQEFISVEIELSFPPEPFHMTIFRDHGVVGGVDGTFITMIRIDDSGVDSLGRRYWITKIRLADR